MLPQTQLRTLGCAAEQVGRRPGGCIVRLLPHGTVAGTGIYRMLLSQLIKVNQNPYIEIKSVFIRSDQSKSDFRGWLKKYIVFGD